MRKAGLTHRQIETATAPPGQRRRLSDWPASPALLVVSGAPSNHKAWTSRPRLAGRAQTFTHGTFPAVTLQVARERARAVERAIAEGTTDRAKLRAIARGADPNHLAHPLDTIETVVAEFMTRRLHGRRRASSYIVRVQGRFRNYILPAFSGQDIRTITRREIITLLDRVHDRAGPAVANLTLANLRTLFRWARERDFVEASPAEGISMPGTMVKRERVLDDRELALVMRAARRLGYPFGTYVQLLVLTGLRRSEAATLRWTDIDLASGVIAILPERMKARRPHVAPLTPTVLDLLTHCPRHEPFVLTNDGTKPLISFDWVKEQIDKLAPEIAPWTLHDLRRSAATGMARLGISRFVVARVLAHTDREITGVYDRYEYLAEKRTALEKWAAHVVGLLQPQRVGAQQPLPAVQHPVEAARGR
jgi:integrase